MNSFKSPYCKLSRYDDVETATTKQLPEEQYFRKYITAIIIMVWLHYLFWLSPCDNFMKTCVIIDGSLEVSSHSLLF